MTAASRRPGLPMRRAFDGKRSLYDLRLSRGEAVDVWRPVEAIQLSGDAFRIVGDNQDPYDEQWQFNSDDVARSQRKVFPGGQSELAAVESLADAI